MSTDLFVDDLNKASNDKLFSAIAEFASAQPNEGWRHDYTETWDDSALKGIAAFANTFGGLLFVGVRKRKHDSVCSLVGVDSQTEYKTRIASAIAANITPVPFYEIFECHEPGASSKKFCVIRVKNSTNLYLMTKKDFQPVYVRNEDEARPADAVQLRRLIDREKETQGLAEKASEQAGVLSDALRVNWAYVDKDSETWFLSSRQSSSTFLKLELIPSEAVSLDMERSHEDQLWNLVAKIYPRIADCVKRNVANQLETRGSDFYEYGSYHKNLDYELRWRITSNGEIAFATQMKCEHEIGKSVWSVVDLAVYIILFVRLSMQWWEGIGYFGEGRLFAQLSVPGLELLRPDPQGAFTYAFDPRYTATAFVPFSISSDAILAAVPSRSVAEADLKVNYFSATSHIARITTTLLNVLLRSLGHAVIWNRLEHDIQLFVEK